MEKKVLFTLQQRRGIVWRDTPVLVGGIFEHLLNYNWITKGGGCFSVAPGLLGHCNLRLQFVPVLSSACGCREQLVLFLLPGIFSLGDLGSEE